MGHFNNLGVDTSIENSSIAQSIVLDETHVPHIERIENRFIDVRAKLKEADKRIKAVKLLIGDAAKLVL